MPSKYSKAAPSWVRSLRVLHRLIVVRIEAAELHVKNLSVTPRLARPAMMRATVCMEAASGLSASMFVMGSRYCGGLATPPTPAGAMALASIGLRLHGAVDDDLVLLGKEIGLIGGEDRVERVRRRLAARTAAATRP